MSIEKFCLKAGTAIMTMGMLAGFSGCTETQVVETSKVIVMATEKLVDFPTPRITPAVTPCLVDETDIETKKDEETEVFDSEDSLDLGEIFENAPEIEGLNKEIQDNKVFYTYKEGNIYDGEVGEYAGVYKDNVYYKGEKIGGACLGANICENLLKNDFDQLSQNESEVKITVPLDVTKYDGDFKIEKITTSDFDGYGCFFDGTLNFVDVCPGVNKYFTSPELFDGFLITDEDNPIYIRQTVLNESGFIKNEQGNYYQMGQLFYYFSQGFLNFNSDYQSSFGTSICQIDSSLVIGLGAVNDNVFEATTMPSDAFLTVDGKTIVFMESPANPISFEEN